MRANAARLAFGGCQSPASIAFIYGNGELPLLKPSKSAILPPNLLESGECRLINAQAAVAGVSTTDERLSGRFSRPDPIHSKSARRT
jgi:hypothetical protein